MNDAALRRALGEFATGVAVVTARGQDGRLVGMTMNSFNSVSLDPPLVLFSVARRASRLAAMLDAKAFAVNLLARDQEPVSRLFARALGQSWDKVKTRIGHAQAPLIAGALAHLECEPYAQYDGGDHVIFVLRVLHCTLHEGDKAPLVFFRGAYHDLAEAHERDPSLVPPV